MIEEKLTRNLQSKGFQILNSNVGGVYLYHKPEDQEAAVISVVHAVTGREFTVEQYRHILEQIQTGLGNGGTRKVSLLSLIFTGNPDQAKQFCSNDGGHWIVDTDLKRLIIYETQPSDFAGLRKDLEAILEEEFRESGQQGIQTDDNRYGGRMRQNRTMPGLIRGIHIFTPVNTAIILINIAVFLVTQYSDLFGGTDVMISRGGDYWYDVVEKHQYYRIITSMFMHSGISHIFNNMLVLLFIGSNLERAAGRLKYLFLYLGSGIIADITSIVYNMWKDKGRAGIFPEYSIGASGAIFGVVGAILYILIINRGRFKDIDIRQMILFIVFGLYGGIASAGIDNAAHIGGFISGILLAIVIYRRPRRSRDKLK